MTNVSDSMKALHSKTTSNTFTPWMDGVANENDEGENVNEQKKVSEKVENGNDEEENVNEEEKGVTSMFSASSSLFEHF
jgi:hypothetical protein